MPKIKVDFKIHASLIKKFDLITSLESCVNATNQKNYSYPSLSLLIPRRLNKFSNFSAVRHR